MLTDELEISVQAGKGGAGCVSFARRKYQPFAGPDGGDGGDGGNVVIRGDKSVESLQHFRNISLVADSGGDGEKNLRHGATGENLVLKVPLGTIAYDARTGSELGDVCSSGKDLIVAKGGKGGRGNSRFKSGTNRSPKAGEPGTPGRNRDLLLKYRIFGFCGLLDPLEEQGSMLSGLLNRSQEDIDRNLYFDKPRWIRIEHDFNRFDPVYLPFMVISDSDIECPLLHHVHWLEILYVNLCPIDGDVSGYIESLFSQLIKIDPVNLKRIVIATSQQTHLPQAVELPNAAEAEIKVTDRTATETIFRSVLAGGVVG